jgi:methylthioribose-1-phosphate isomerase
MRVVNGEQSMETRAVWFENGRVRMIDQRLIPQQFQVIDLQDHTGVAEAIRNMAVRGAPSIGAAAAYGMALAARNGVNINAAAAELKGTRPTAYDLFYAVDHMMAMLERGDDPVQAADAYADQVVERCRLIGEYGAELIKDENNIMTHCNAGALATVDIGTALAPIRTAWQRGRRIYVYVSETRPRLQGMRLTAWELYNEGIPHSIIVDGAAGHYLRKDVNLVIVGADRIAANGDFANKIGTFDKAVLCSELAVPFYVAAPISTFDFSISTGNDIVIEDRSEDEVTQVGAERLAPEGSPALNPSFDMTPAKYVTGFITEVGILRPAEIERVRKAQVTGDEP